MRRLAFAICALGACAHAGSGASGDFGAGGAFGVTGAGGSGTTGASSVSSSSQASAGSSQPAANASSAASGADASASSAQSGADAAASSAASTDASASAASAASSSAMSAAASSSAGSSSVASSSVASSSSSGMMVNCDPLNPGAGCGANMHCLPEQNHVAQCQGPTGNGQQYDVCAGNADCQPAFACVQTPFQTVYCLQWCTSDNDCMPLDFCTFFKPALYVGATQYGVCYDGLS